MKKIISTRFLLSLQDASQKGIDKDAKVLEDEYDEFVILLLTDSALSSDMTAYRNSLFIPVQNLPV
jgi:hypothetical protein